MNKIHILDFHYKGHPTIIIGDYCKNGCQHFHSSDAESVFEEFDVPRRYQKDVMTRFYKVDPNEPFDLAVLDTADIFSRKYIIETILTHYPNKHIIDFLFNHSEKELICAGMKYYNPQQIKALSSYESIVHTEEFATYCDINQLDSLVDSPSEDVRMAVAERGIKKHLDILVNDKSVWVLQKVAQHGIKEHLDVLIKNKNIGVRKTVALYGNREHLDVLIDDPSEFVRMAVVERGIKEHLDILVNDESAWVRFNIVEFGDKEHVEKLLNDEVNYIRDYAKLTITDK